MEITHESFNKILHKDYGESFKRMFSNRNFEDLLTEIDSISNLADDYGYLNSDIEGEEKSSKYKFIGDLFEIFAEVFFLTI